MCGGVLWDFVLFYFFVDGVECDDICFVVIFFDYDCCFFVVDGED